MFKIENDDRVWVAYDYGELCVIKSDIIRESNSIPPPTLYISESRSFWYKEILGYDGH